MFAYQLIGTDESRGAIRFEGNLDPVTRNSRTHEYWCPEPSGPPPMDWRWPPPLP